MTKANTLPKVPFAVARTPRTILRCDVVAADWPNGCSTVGVVVRRNPARAIQRTDTPDTPGLWRYFVYILGTGTDPFWREVTSEEEAMSCVEVIKLRPLTPRLCLEIGFLP